MTKRFGEKNKYTKLERIIRYLQKIQAFLSIKKKNFKERKCVQIVLLKNQIITSVYNFFSVS